MNNTPVDKWPYYILEVYMQKLTENLLKVDTESRKDSIMVILLLHSSTPTVNQRKENCDIFRFFILFAFNHQVLCSKKKLS